MRNYNVWLILETTSVSLVSLNANRCVLEDEAEILVPQSA